ncbi:hypothetical protein PHLGIDRAFT_517224 [Phlebiopsis gigantea 11061_1 CR5-6]|uniref:Endonuclease/exonuclease/phosphatase domain-containing protein n=1 Tax=Phlebiopsis gigantea (strain 11061_1 CR5-6) TaxID=745531 RepID=A0A0C3NLE9_PHLG1|nr:hypothetical protein PHLGIDRAFT_517224 [Phlebiopsis gigantea 11061_1 CR5-6]
MPYQPNTHILAPDVLTEVRPRCWSRTRQGWRPISRSKRRKSATRATPPSPISAYHPRSRTRTPLCAPIELNNEPIPESLQLLTWNVEAYGPNARTRLATILKHIQGTIFGCPDGEQPEPCCILLQEVNACALPAVLENAWVREHFVVAPTTAEHWPSAHVPTGNVTLVARTVPVTRAQTLEFAHSPMRRHALAVDVRLGVPTAASESDADSDSDSALGPERTLRIVNVHLESLARGTPLRPVQLLAAAKMLLDPAVHAGVVAGDMNAIAPDDWDLPAYVGLEDAWAGEDDGRGTTWGYQPPSREFPPGRLDKVLYVPNGTCEVGRPDRVGVGVKTAAGQWASDHFGLLTTVSLQP